MKKRLEYSVNKLAQAARKLRDGAEQARDELGRDGVIQRFEFTFELLWKTLKIFLENEGVETKTPRESLKEGFRIGLISDEETYLDMLEDRNLTTHIYDKNTSGEIFKRIKKTYIAEIEALLKKLKKGR
jgi:nucleotidyltransferase substrate binding protein (TIGR01987 family)